MCVGYLEVDLLQLLVVLLQLCLVLVQPHEVLLNPVLQLQGLHLLAHGHDEAVLAVEQLAARGGRNRQLVVQQGDVLLQEGAGGQLDVCSLSTSGE